MFYIFKIRGVDLDNYVQPTGIIKTDLNKLHLVEYFLAVCHKL